MAQYKVFEPGIESGGHELPVVAFGTLGTIQKNEIIKKYSINTSEGAWNDLQNLLYALQEVEDTLGHMNLFLIGKAVMSEVEFPPMDGLEDALKSIDIAYHMNHRKNGKIMFDPETGTMLEGIGHYELTKFDAVEKKAEMVCHTPYPSHCEEGLLTQTVRMFKPKGSLLPTVKLDINKETKRNGGDSCTYQISW